jgi:ribosomal protein S18 acetylase RimI-like enzyme
MDPVIYYRRAVADDVDVLTAHRLSFLAEISGASSSDPALRAAIAQYFSQSIPTNHFIAFLALANEKIIATSGMTYHHHPPSNKNPAGREAYIMNMYTQPEFRRRGIATHLLQMLIDEARQTQCGKISLHVMLGARSIYSSLGFELIETEMRLNLLPVPHK